MISSFACQLTTPALDRTIFTKGGNQPIFVPLTMRTPNLFLASSGLSRLPHFVAVALVFLACISSAEDSAPLDPEELNWNALPSELTDRVFPFSDRSDLRLKAGKTKDDQPFVRIQLRKKDYLSFGVKSDPSSDRGYVATARRGFFWPDQHLLRLEEDVIVNASSCRLEGDSFDIHLLHDTTRLSGKEMVITLPQGLAPIESDSVRISSLGGSDKPFFAWDTGTPGKANTPERKPIRREYAIDLNHEGKITFEGKACDIDELRERIRDLAGKETDSSFALQLEPTVEADLVRKIKDLLVESGFDDIEMVTVTPKLKEQRLRPEIAETTFIDESTSIPTQIGGRLLWIQSVGNYFPQRPPLR